MPTASKRQRLLQRLLLCLVCNVLLLALTLTLICCFARESTYFRFGPHAGLSVVGVPIDTWQSYICLHAVLLVTQVIDVLGICRWVCYFSSNFSSFESNTDMRS
jgi:hypothetical protein